MAFRYPVGEVVFVSALRSFAVSSPLFAGYTYSTVISRKNGQYYVEQNDFFRGKAVNVTPVGRMPDMLSALSLAVGL